MTIKNFKLDTGDTCKKWSIHDHWKFTAWASSRDLRATSSGSLLFLWPPLKASKWCQIIKGSIWNCRSMILRGSKNLKLSNLKLVGQTCEDSTHPFGHVQGPGAQNLQRFLEAIQTVSEHEQSTESSRGVTANISSPWKKRAQAVGMLEVDLLWCWVAAQLATVRQHFDFRLEGGKKKTCKDLPRDSRAFCKPPSAFG